MVIDMYILLEPQNLRIPHIRAINERAEKQQRKDGQYATPRQLGTKLQQNNNVKPKTYRQSIFNTALLIILPSSSPSPASIPPPPLPCSIISSCIFSFILVKHRLHARLRNAEEQTEQISNPRARKLLSQRSPARSCRDPTG